MLNQNIKNIQPTFFVSLWESRFIMKALLFTLSLLLLLGCESTKTVTDVNPDDVVLIANDEIEYEIIIIEPGFNSWLLSQPGKGYHGLEYLENQNRRKVLEYNRRVFDMNYPRNLYQQEINYDPSVSYGLEVNYLLYNYFVYFEKTYKQKL